MSKHKKLHCLASLKKIFTLLISLGFLNLSHAGDLTNLVPAQNIYSNIFSAQIEKNKNTDDEPIVLLHEKWKHRSLNLFADFEEPWRDSAVEAKISDAQQEGGCALIKASFSF